ncbi:MAG: hypothetical protein AAGC62_13370, partial [Pseudomonadota bacterium]
GARRGAEVCDGAGAGRRHGVVGGFSGGGAGAAADGDGKLSETELGSGPGRRFARMDRDGDGVLTREEAQEARWGRGGHKGGRGYGPRGPVGE